MFPGLDTDLGPGANLSMSKDIFHAAIGPVGFSSLGLDHCFAKGRFDRAFQI